MPTKTLPVFTKEQYQLAHRLLAARVAHMMGRKFEEGDWADVYCGAKTIPKAEWSNLNIDISCGNLGVEQKMLMKPSSRALTTWCGTLLMHPAATRAIRIDSLDRDPNDVMRDVFRQYAELIARRTEKVRENGGGEPDMRTGWLLWQDSLREFMYFEEPMVAPNPDEYRAVWSERTTVGARLGSKNLWIYDKKTEEKRFSVTTQAGIKIQPYFQVPPHDDPNLYLFIVQGEFLGDDLVRVWLTTPTATDLKALVGSLDSDTLSKAILAAKVKTGEAALHAEMEDVVEVRVSAEAYERVLRDFEGASDEQRFRLLVSSLDS
jgi:hypothetical protein